MGCFLKIHLASILTNALSEPPFLQLLLSGLSVCFPAALFRAGSLPSCCNHYKSGTWGTSCHCWVFCCPFCCRLSSELTWLKGISAWFPFWCLKLCFRSSASLSCFLSEEIAEFVGTSLASMNFSGNSVFYCVCLGLTETGHCCAGRCPVQTPLCYVSHRVLLVCPDSPWLRAVVSKYPSPPLHCLRHWSF